MLEKTLVLSLLLAGLLGPTRQASAVCNNPLQFGSPTNHVTGPNPLFVATGDFNEDGKLDLAVTNSDFPTIAPAGSVSILLGTGGFGFAPAVNYTVGSVPHGIVAGDFNGDGILDLAVANKFSNTISVLIGQGSGGNGNGAFAAHVTYGTTFHPFQLVTADFNEDGILDLAMSMNNASRMGVMLGQGSGGVGNGSFAPPTLYTLNAASTGIATADFNADGILDLVATENVAGTVEVRLGNGAGGVGNGTFGAATHFSAGAEPSDFAVDDFNGDGILDLAVANTNAAGTGILLGVGNGAFQAPNFLNSGNTASVASLDANGDGIKDLATGTATGTDGGQLSLYLGFGNGTFLPPTVYATNLDQYQVIPADINLDGKPDLITAAFLNNFIQVFPGACLSAPPPPADPRKPVLTDVRDVSHDQGGKVFLTWTPSSLDVSGGPVNSYRVWRRVPPAFAARIVRGDDSTPAMRTISLNGTADVEYWEAIVTLPAQRRAGYGYTAATNSDSTESWVPYEAFFVSALTGNIDTFYDSNVDSGYSVDNIPPSAPSGLAGLVTGPGLQLQWQANTEPDLESYRVYRGSDPGFVPDAAHLVASPTDPSWIDGTAGAFSYRVTAVDKHGNESEVSEATTPTVVGVQPTPTFEFALRGATPNPAVGANLVISFTLPSSQAASLRLVDVAGRTVATRTLRAPTPGAQVLSLNGPERLRAGIYLLHLEQGTRSAVSKVVISR